MPYITVHAWEDVIDEQTAEKLIANVTDAVSDSLGQHVREFTTVIVTGVPRYRWGSGGAPAGRSTATGLDAV